MKTFVNGLESSTISVFDRGLHYGDGLFETIRVVNHQIPLLNEHLLRLEESCQRLSIPMNSLAAIKEELSLAAEVYAASIIKLILTRGILDKRGYASSVKGLPTRIVIVDEYRLLDVKPVTDVKAMVCRTRLSRNESLAGLKHLNKLEYVLASDEVALQGLDEGVLLDTEGNVIECTKANIFFVKDGCLYTPDLSNSGVAGVMRTKLIDLANEKYSWQTQISNYPLVTLLDADEVFLCNGVVGVKPITQIDGVCYEVGEVSVKLASEIQAFFI